MDKNKDFDSEIKQTYQNKINDLYNAFINNENSHCSKLVKKIEKSMIEDYQEDAIDFEPSNLTARIIDVDLKEAIDFAKNDLDIIQKEFIEFQSKIEHLGIYSFFLDAVEDFATFGAYLGGLVEDFHLFEEYMATKEEATKDEKIAYEQLEKIKNNILVSIYLHYKGDQL